MKTPEEIDSEFVPHAESLLLKEIRFNAPCMTVYSEEGHKSPLRQFFVHNSNVPSYATGPTYRQAFKWFRDKYKIIVVIDFYNDGEEFEDTKFMFKICDYVDFKTHDTFLSNTSYKTYEETELACLKKLIEIVKDKSK